MHVMIMYFVCTMCLQFGDSAVQYAAYNGHMEAVKLLVEQHHADVTFVNQVTTISIYVHLLFAKAAIKYSSIFLASHLW